MQVAALKKFNLPDAPGVYFFRDSGNRILYIGKATSLKSRVRSYFANDLIKSRGPRIVDMVTKASRVTFEQTDSVLEALLREGQLIRTHQPPYNTDGKDDKSYNHVVITNEEWPRVLLIRGKDLDPIADSLKLKAIYGPFPHGGQLKEAMRLLKRIFPFYDTKRPVTEIKSRSERGKIVFNRQIGLYPTDDNKEAYQKTIRQIMLLFNGKKKALLRELEKQMKAYAKSQEFELAAEMKRRLEALTHIQDVSLLKREYRSTEAEPERIEGYDIAHMAGKEMVGVMVVLSRGEPQKSEYRLFNIKTVTGSNDTAALREVVGRRLAHSEWPMPKLIVVDGGRAQKAAVEKELASSGVMIPVVSVVKDEKHRPREIIGAKEHREGKEADIILADLEAHRFAIKAHRRKLGKRFK